VPLSIPSRPARRSFWRVALLVVVAMALPAAAFAARPPSVVVNIQILNVSDWHGWVDPNNGNGGAWNLSARFTQDRLAMPTLTLTAGDDFGATPALVNSFDETPAVLAQRLMGIQVGTFGNHNFDRGTAFLQTKIDQAGAPTDADHPGNPYRYVASNLKNLSGNLAGVDPIAYFNVGGAKIAVIAIVNEEAPTLVFPGSFGTIIPTDGVAAANKNAAIARKAGANAVLVITHKGIRGLSPAPFGELLDFANALQPGLVDVVFGDHTDVQYSGTTTNGILVHENRSFGFGYAKTMLTVQTGRGGGVSAKSVSFVVPGPAGTLGSNNMSCAGGTAAFCDQAVLDMLAPFRAALGPIFGVKVGDSTKPMPRADQCGQSAGRLCESFVGVAVADKLRQTVATDIALKNSGGLRASLTCPTTDNGTDFCPAALYPVPNGGLYPITRGTVNDLLPFGNVSTTISVNGAELLTMLERGVSFMPGADGRYPQISGLCFTYDVAEPAFSRVTGAVWANPDGTCGATAVDLTSASTYSVATNNFTASGGDGYPNFSSRMTTFGILDVDLAAWLTGKGIINPFVLGAPDGRSNCIDGNGAGVGDDCPVLTVSLPVPPAP
jgi:2',3'-cyclic-nucleotide 2'-phosphodiesterase (5'-nucleotidase family)